MKKATETSTATVKRQPDEILQQAGKTRRLVRSLALPATLVACMVGPDINAGIQDQKRQKVQAALADVGEAVTGDPAKKLEYKYDTPVSLQAAHKQAAQTLYEGSKNPALSATNAVEHMAVALNEEEGRWQIDIEEVLGDKIETSVDGKSFKVGDKTISLGSVTDQHGTVLVVSGQTRMKDGEVIMVAPHLLGGQKAMEGLTKEQQEALAFANAREIFEQALKKPTEHVDEPKDEQVLAGGL